MVRHAARVAIVGSTIATLAPPPVNGLALNFVMSFGFARLLALGLFPLGRGGTT